MAETATIPTSDKELHDGTFPFLQLPKEIRLMIYEVLPIKTKHYTLGMRDPDDEDEDHSVTLVMHTIPGLSILQTCRLVNAEAKTILDPLKCQPVQLLSDPLQMVSSPLFGILLSAITVGAGRSLSDLDVDAALERRFLLRLTHLVDFHVRRPYLPDPHRTPYLPAFVEIALREPQEDQAPSLGMGLHSLRKFVTDWVPKCHEISAAVSVRMMFIEGLAWEDDFHLEKEHLWNNSRVVEDTKQRSEGFTDRFWVIDRASDLTKEEYQARWQESEEIQEDRI